MTVTPQLRAILLAGGLAAVALVLGFVTLGMNQSSSNAATPSIGPGITTRSAPKPQPVAGPAKAAKPKPKVDPVRAAARKAGLPDSIASALATRSVVVVSVFDSHSSVDAMARDEAAVGAKLAGAGFVRVDVSKEGDAPKLTALLGRLPAAPGLLVFTRSGLATPRLVLDGFYDQQVVAQAATNAPSAPALTTGGTTAAAPAPAIAPAAAPTDATLAP